MCLVFSTKYTEKEFYLLMFHFGLGVELEKSNWDNRKLMECTEEICKFLQLELQMQVK